MPPAPFLQCEPCLTPGGSGVLSDPARIDEEFRKAWLPYFCRSAQRETSLEEFDCEVEGWLLLVPEVHLPRLTGQMLADVVHRKSVSAGSLDGWGWRELKVLPLSWYDELARILTKDEDVGVWPDGLLDAYIAMIPKTDGDATPLGQRPLSVLPVVYRIWASARMSQLDGWFKSWVPDSVFSAGSGRCSVEAWYTTALDIGEVLSGAAHSHVHLFVADVVKSFDTVDRAILDRVLSRLGLSGWFRHAYFEYHAHVRLRFKLASGLGKSWTRNGGIPQGCPLSMMFIVALYLPWCRYLASQVGVQPQLYADNLKCVSRNPDLLPSAARFTTQYVRLVGQEPAPSKWNAHTEAIRTRVFHVFSACRNTHTHQTHTTTNNNTTTTTTHTTQHHNTQHHTETETERDRERERQRKRDREETRRWKRRDEKRQEKMKEKRRNEKMEEERREKTREDERGEKRHVNMKEERQDKRREDREKRREKTRREKMKEKMKR